MEDSALTVALYAREVAPTEPDPQPSLYLTHKWDGLEKALESDAEVVAVAFPGSWATTSPTSAPGDITPLDQRPISGTSSNVLRP